MEARREKLMQAKASFQKQGSLSSYPSTKERKEKKETGQGKEFGHILLIIRILTASALFLLYIYGMKVDESKINEIARKSCMEIKKNETFIERCSVQLGKIW